MTEPNTAACPAASRTLAVAVASSTSKLTDADKNSRLAAPWAGEPAGDGNQDGVDEPVLRPGRVATSARISP